MVSGKDLIERGWPQGRTIGLALAAAGRLRSAGMDDDAVLRELEKIRAAPDSVPDAVLEPLARELTSKPEADAAALEDALREEPLPYGVWGTDLIEAGTTAQMEDAMRLPVSVGGVLMPDAHLGYGLPVGGVLATEGAVIPWAVGVDITCRMRLSVFGVDPALLDERRADLANVLLRNTNFGAGSKYKEGRRPEHEVLEDPAWEVTSFLKSLKDTGRAQLGTSGSGNHFVEWGVFEALGEIGDALTQPEEGVRQEGAEEAFETGRRYLALLSHSGSRGVGFKIANRYSKVAKEKHPKLEGSVADLAWLDLDDEEGGEYWLSMQLAGRFASANHAVIHDKIARALGEEAMTKVENHHNRAWRERVGERSHRASQGGDASGQGGYGCDPRVYGRPRLRRARQGRREVPELRFPRSGQAHEPLGGLQEPLGGALAGLPRRAGRHPHRGGSLDEAPMAYKDIEAVVGLQGDLVDLVGRFIPKIVRMDAGGKPWGKKKRR